MAKNSSALTSPLAYRICECQRNMLDLHGFCKFYQKNFTIIACMYFLGMVVASGLRSAVIAKPGRKCRPMDIA